MSRDLLGVVTCRNCGHFDEVSGPVCAPTPTIVAKVCLRDPCPECGALKMEPIEDRAVSEYAEMR
jgi:hypothetical protein